MIVLELSFPSSKKLEKYVFLKIICRHKSVWVVQIMLLLLLILASTAHLFKICFNL